MGVFFILVYLTFVMLIPKIHLVLLCRNTSRMLRRDCLNAQILHPHSKRLQGIAKKTMYFEYMLTGGSSQNFPRDPILVLATATHFMMS